MSDIPFYKDRLGVDLTAQESSHYIMAEEISNIKMGEIVTLRHDIFYKNIIVYSVLGDTDGSMLQYGIDYSLEQMDSIATSHSNKECFRGVIFTKDYAKLYINYHVYGDLIQSAYFGDLVADTMGGLEQEIEERILGDDLLLSIIKTNKNESAKADIAHDEQINDLNATIDQLTQQLANAQSALEQHGNLSALANPDEGDLGEPDEGDSEAPEEGWDEKILGHVTVGTEPGDVPVIGDDGFLNSSIMPASNAENDTIPVGYIYTQYPSCHSPKELWPKFNWEDITPSYAGLFFRAEGGLSTAFNTGTQSDSSPNITGQLGNVSNYGQAINGAFAAYNQYTYAGGSHKMNTVNFYASRSSASYGRRNEVAPINQSIKIWRRTGTMIEQKNIFYQYDDVGLLMRTLSVSRDEAGLIGYNDNCMTDTAPPTPSSTRKGSLQSSKVSIFDANEKKWVSVNDTRGVTAYNKESGQGRVLLNFDQPTDDETLLSPAGLLNPEWDGHQWIESTLIDE